MNVAVRCFSKSGNTLKVANAIADAVDVPALSTDMPLKEPVDLLFLGGGLYAGSVHKHLKAFAETLTSDMVGEVVIFSTAAGPNTAEAELKALLTPKNIKVSDKVFSCRGKFLFASRSHPDEQDLENAKAFAKQFIK